MIIDVLVCRPDGTQAVEQREVPDNWFGPSVEDGAAVDSNQGITKE